MDTEHHALSSPSSLTARARVAFRSHRQIAARLRPVGVIVALCAASALAAGCATSTPPASRAALAEAAPMRAEAPATVAAGAPVQSRPSSESAVAISDEILKACAIPADEALFPFDSARVGAGSAKPLADVASCFRTGPLKGRAMKIVGRADPRGDTDYNFALGQRRADSVAGFLHDTGLSPGQMATTSRGATDATGSDESGWARDRRVDILLAR